MASLLPESLEAQLVGPRTVHGGRNYGQCTEGRGGQSLSVHRGSVHMSPGRSLVRDVFCCLRVRVTIRGKTVTQRARGGLRTPQLPVTGRMSLPRARVGWRTVCTGGSVKRWLPVAPGARWGDNLQGQGGGNAWGCLQGFCGDNSLSPAAGTSGGSSGSSGSSTRLFRCLRCLCAACAPPKQQ
ncbi:hypothetical protein NDU88_006716 [Pleurodeles waltl]|uniref:Uncharacterized protein n=1 Tax=Pleurodeles waltl TaxID=8319 RepID=A0AAV7X2B6_PLEWA|nr:hypothetical protein NDU88_006716 [Pleurodeles waltl]